MASDMLTVQTTLMNMKSAIANLSEYPQLAHFQPVKESFWKQYKSHDFQFYQGKLSPEAMVIANGFTNADSFHAILDVWNSACSIEDDDIQDNVLENVLGPFEDQLILLKDSCASLLPLISKLLKGGPNQHLLRVSEIATSCCQICAQLVCDVH
jgi:hypothetical protein